MPFEYDPTTWKQCVGCGRTLFRCETAFRLTVVDKRWACSSCAAAHQLELRERLNWGLPPRPVREVMADIDFQLDQIDRIGEELRRAG